MGGASLDSQIEGGALLVAPFLEHVGVDAMDDVQRRIVELDELRRPFGRVDVVRQQGARL